jgi:hypothetical protein
LRASSATAFSLLASRGGDLDWSALALLAKRDAGGETPLRRSE